jgi:hypothetical protein
MDVLRSSAQDCEEFEVTYSEWGELGLTLREQAGAHWVVKVNPKSAALGAKVGSILLSVNNNSVVEMRHHQMLTAVSEADWPKTLKFKILKDYSKAQQAFQESNPQKRRVDAYEVSFNEPSGNSLLGMTFVSSEHLPKGTGAITISDSKDPAVSKGITVDSKLLTINGKETTGLTEVEVEAMLANATWPVKLKLHGPRPSKNK